MPPAQTIPLQAHLTPLPWSTAPHLREALSPTPRQTYSRNYPVALPDMMPMLASPTARLGIVVNQEAGSYARLGKTVLARMIANLGLTQQIELVHCKGAALRHNARELVNSGVAYVGVFGGDGSARSVIHALAGLNVPVLPLPGGTLNRLCHRVHGHACLKPILARLQHARPIWLSGGYANEHMFLVASGFGPWMGFQQVREAMCEKAGTHGLNRLRALRHELFAGLMRMHGLNGEADIIVAAPGYVDSAFGLGKSHADLAPHHGLEICTARLPSPFAAAGLGAHILARNWRALPNVSYQSGDQFGVITQEDRYADTQNQKIIGLVDGELCDLGTHVHLTYEPRAALVMTTR